MSIPSLLQKLPSRHNRKNEPPPCRTKVYNHSILRSPSSSSSILLLAWISSEMQPHTLLPTQLAGGRLCTQSVRSNRHLEVAKQVGLDLNQPKFEIRFRMLDPRRNLQTKQTEFTNVSYTGATPLHLVVVRGSLEAIRLISEGCHQLNPKLGIRDDTPLFLALRKKWPTAAMHLMDQGVSPIVQGCSTTAIHIAAQSTL
jgi:hypothetical protein